MCKLYIGNKDIPLWAFYKCVIYVANRLFLFLRL